MRIFKIKKNKKYWFNFEPPSVRPIQLNLIFIFQRQAYNYYLTAHLQKRIKTWEKKTLSEQFKWAIFVRNRQLFEKLNGGNERNGCKTCCHVWIDQTGNLCQEKLRNVCTISGETRNLFFWFDASYTWCFYVDSNSIFKMGSK